MLKNADELAEKLKVSRRQIQLLAERREIPFLHVGPRCLRFDEEEVMAALKRVPKADNLENLVVSDET